MMERTMQDKPYPQRRRTPSFSSTLLDSIYRSIDESKSNLDEDPQLGLFKETTTHKSKHNNLSYNYNYNHGVYVEKNVNKEKMNIRRAVMIEDWMEKKSSKSSQFMNSTSSSSESSSGAVFSSSETDTTHKTRPQKRNSEKNQQKQKQKPHREGGFARTKLRALKIYGELNQKVKQPISPGSRIASFLSSIFNSAGNVKKAKMCYVGTVEDVSFEHKSKSSSSPCFSSSASSFSRRSCMSKTPGKSNNGVKRSVRFYPVSVILGEEENSQPCGHRYIYENDPSLLPMTRSSSIKELKKNSVMAKENGAEAAACGFMKGYQNSGKGSKFGFGGFYGNDEDDDDDDDALSYSSSDLFELDHLIGAAGRYQEELPVYETTNLETNKAIANGLRL